MLICCNVTQVPSPVSVEIPVCYSLGINEKKFPHGAYVRLRFFDAAPGTPKGWLLGCLFVNKQVSAPPTPPPLLLLLLLLPPPPPPPLPQPLLLLLPWVVMCLRVEEVAAERGKLRDWCGEVRCTCICAATDVCYALCCCYSFCYCCC